MESGEMSCGLSHRGAYLMFLRFENRELIQPSLDGHQTHGGSAVLIPYANRVRNGTYQYEGTTYHLPLDRDGNSIHGLVRDMSWDSRKISENEVEFYSVLMHESYPSYLKVAVRYSLSSYSMTLYSKCENVGPRTCPLMVGFHPYFAMEEWHIKSEMPMFSLHKQDDSWPDGGMDMARQDGLNWKGSFDSTFLSYGSLIISDIKIKIRMERFNMPFLQLYNGKYARGTAVAVEPMTGAPDCYNNGMGLLSLPPGDSFSCGFRITVIR